MPPYFQSDPLAFLVDLFFFFFNDTATTEIYTLSLHDALPISRPSAITISAPRRLSSARPYIGISQPTPPPSVRPAIDRKSTRLNSSHSQISYAVFCLKKKHDSSPVNL